MSRGGSSGWLSSAWGRPWPRRQRGSTGGALGGEETREEKVKGRGREWRRRGKEKEEVRVSRSLKGAAFIGRGRAGGELPSRWHGDGDGTDARVRTEEGEGVAGWRSWAGWRGR